MKKYQDENGNIITIDELKREYESLKRSNDTEAETFGAYISNCMYYNGGTLKERRRNESF